MTASENTRGHMWGGVLIINPFSFSVSYTSCGRRCVLVLSFPEREVVCSNTPMVVHTVQKPSISLWLFLDNARFIYLTIYPCLLLLFLTATRMERLVLFFQEPVAEAAQELRYFLTITLLCTLMILLDPIPLVTSLCYN